MTIPDTNPDVPHWPMHMAEPRQPELTEAARHDADAEASTWTGDDAGAVADTYAAGDDGRAGRAATRPVMKTRLHPSPRERSVTTCPGGSAGGGERLHH